MTFNANTFYRSALPAVLLVIIAGTIVYSNTFQVPFVLDDQSSIVNNIAIQKPDNVFHAYKLGLKFLRNRLVVFLTFALNYHFGGLNVTGYHVVNLLIHLVTAILAYALLRLTFRTPYFQAEESGLEPPKTFYSSLLTPYNFIPLFGALLFVVHPLQTQSVTYIVQRMASLATMFYLLSMVLYVQARLLAQNAKGRMQNTENKNSLHGRRENIKSWLFIAGSTLAAVLGMKTKEIAFTLPLAIVLYEIFFFRGAWKRRLLFLLPLLATLPIIPLGIMTIGGTSEDIISTAGEQLRVSSSLSRLDYLFTQFRVIVTYLRLLVLPVNQNLDYDYPVFTTFLTLPVFLSFLLLAFIFGLGIYLFYRSRFSLQPAFRLISFGIIWFFLTLSVESSLVPIKDVIMEHRLYLPLFGAATAFATIFYLLVEKLTGPSSGKLLLLSATLLAAMLSVSTYQRNHIWGDPVRLWQDVVAKSPNKARPINNLGKALEGVGRRDEAFRAFSRAITLEPGYYKAYYNLADLYLVSDQPEKALLLLQTAIRLNPDFTEAYVSAGAALMRAGKFREVTTFLEQNLDRIGDKAEARFYLGASYAFLGNREAALRELAVLSRLDASYTANLAGMLGMKKGQGMPHGK